MIMMLSIVNYKEIHKSKSSSIEPLVMLSVRVVVGNIPYFQTETSLVKYREIHYSKSSSMKPLVMLSVRVVEGNIPYF